MTHVYDITTIWRATQRVELDEPVDKWETLGDWADQVDSSGAELIDWHAQEVRQ